MTKELINFLKVQNDNAYSLTVDEAASHIIALQNYFETYLSQYIDSIGDNADLIFLELQKKKVINFLSVMKDVLEKSNHRNYLYETILISRDKLSEIEQHYLSTNRNLESTLKDGAEDLLKKANIIDAEIGGIVKLFKSL